MGQVLGGGNVGGQVLNKYIVQLLEILVVFTNVVC